MKTKHYLLSNIVIILLISLITFFPLTLQAEEMAASTIAEAKLAIEQAQIAGAEQHAGDELAAAKSWLGQALKAHADATSLMAKVSTSKMKRAREEGVIFLASMAKIKGLSAEARAKKYAIAAKLKDSQKDLTDYLNTTVILKEKLEEAARAKETQAKAAAELKRLASTQRTADEIEAQKRAELSEAKKKMAELEALKQKEIRETQSKEAQLIAAREQEAATARLKNAQIEAQRAKETIEIKAKQEVFEANKEKMTAMQAKLQALEREKALLDAAGNIPKTTVKAGNQKIVMTILAISLFSAANELTAEGKEIVNKISKLLDDYPGSTINISGYTDNRGAKAKNVIVSEKRAREIREYIVSYRNISSGRITAAGLGPEQPVANNATAEGRALNRRMELTILFDEIAKKQK